MKNLRKLQRATKKTITSVFTYTAMLVVGGLTTLTQDHTWGHLTPFAAPFLVQLLVRYLYEKEVNLTLEAPHTDQSLQQPKVSLSQLESTFSGHLNNGNKENLVIKISINYATEVIRLTTTNGLNAEQKLISLFEEKINTHFSDAHTFSLNCCSFIVIMQGNIDQNRETITQFKKQYGHLIFNEEGMRFFPKLLIGTTSLTKNLGDTLSRLEFAAHNAAMLTPLNSWHIKTDDPAYLKHRNSRIQLRHVRHVLYHQELGLFVQPIVLLQGKQSLPKYELLLRHYTSANEVDTPGNILMHANYNRVTQDIDIYVITLLCQNFKRLFGSSGEKIAAISINISGNSFAIPRFVDVIDDIVIKYNIPKDKLILEVTEDIASSDMADSRATMANFRGRGFKLALDDIGTGSSNFQNLRNLPIDYFKIDRAYCEAMLEDKPTYEFVKMIIGVAKLKGKFVIAEGIPDEATKQKLIELGADYSQSFITGMPHELIVAPKYSDTHRGSVNTAVTAA